RSGGGRHCRSAPGLGINLRGCPEVCEGQAEAPGTTAGAGESAGIDGAFFRRSAAGSGVGAGFIQKFGVSDPLAAFGAVSPLQGGDYICHKARVSLPLVRGRRERSERGGRSSELLCKARLSDEILRPAHILPRVFISRKRQNLLSARSEIHIARDDGKDFLARHRREQSWRDNVNTRKPE